MKHIQKILCPTDFGACARAALQQSLRLAEQHDAQIDLLHVANVPRYVRRDMLGVLGAGGARPLSEIALAAAEKQLEQLARELSAQERARLVTHCRFGSPIKTILRYAAAHHADLIVMGAAGQARLARYVLGGIASKTVRRADCPVMCVPGSSARDLRKILVATDFSECSTRALEAGVVLARGAGAKLAVATVTPSAWSLPAEVSLVTGPGTNWLELLQREAREQLDEFVDGALARGLRVDERVLLVGSPAQSLLHHADEEGFDLIVLGTHGRSAVARLMLGSVAETVVHHAQIPVLTARNTEAAANESETDS